MGGVPEVHGEAHGEALGGAPPGAVAFDRLSRALSVEHEVLVVAQQVVVGHATARGRPHHRVAVRTLEVGLDDLVVPAVAVGTTKFSRKKTRLPQRKAQAGQGLLEHEAAQFEALDAQDVDGLLALVREAQVLRVPPQLQALQPWQVVGDAVHELVHVDVDAQALRRPHHQDPVARPLIKRCKHRQ